MKAEGFGAIRVRDWVLEFGSEILGLWVYGFEVLGDFVASGSGCKQDFVGQQY